MKYNDGHVNGCHLREDKYSLIALFPYNAKSEMKKFVLGNKRNETMAKLIKSGYICGQRVKDTDIFWGWDMTFKRETSGQKFLWSMALSQDKWVPTLSAIDDKNNRISEDGMVSELKSELNELRNKFGILVP